MTTHIVAPKPGVHSSAADAPSLDAVIFWLTHTIERDYTGRRVFPECRSDTARATRANATLHHLTMAQAQAMLGDAEARCPDVGRSLKVAFSAHIDNLRSALDEAKGRRAMFEASELVCTRRTEWSECWRGTKAQLRAAGISLDGPYPGEQGGQRYWAKTRDRRGYKVRIKRASMTWAGLFVADIDIPEHVREAEQQSKKQQLSAHQRLKQLKALPATADAFREHVAHALWSVVVPIIEQQMQPSDGYRFTASAMEEFREAMSAAYWAIKGGETTGRSPREKLHEVMAAGARADATLQRFLAGLSSAGAA